MCIVIASIFKILLYQEALLIQLVDQTTILRNPPEVQVTRIQNNNDGNESIAFLIQCPERIDWKRTQFVISFARIDLS